MSSFEAFLINIFMFSAFPIYATSLPHKLRSPSLYAYLSIILIVGGLAGAIYSFPIGEDTFISGGNIAYGSFMMTAVMLIISERSIATFKNLFRLLILVDIFVFVGFNYTAWLLDSDAITSPVELPSEIFKVSLSVMLIGGGLILSEILLLLIIFIQVRRYVTNLNALAGIYTIAFIAIVCLDGVFFPLVALHSHPELGNIILGNVTGKVILAVSYSLPLMMFCLIYRKQFAHFIETPLTIGELIRSPRKKLLDTLYQYEIRDRQLRQDKQELLTKAETDFLTGLFNRGKFNQTFELEWQECKASGQPITLVIGDVDYFKQFNDTYGHEKGDTCIRSIAQLWREILDSEAGLAARIGGEEFALLLPKCHPEEAKIALEEFLVRLDKAAILHSNSLISSHVTMSIGIASCIPTNDTNVKDLYVAADNCLYKAKNDGRNRIITE
ncbi:GGDEF domain-containing protein [Marinomonas posidonica]|uniref:diguanylate cyclase n=1 Tax=Marinomonas posidonica (strain CECT 7376 / NCIMB 14433 / IVIA-Po-181) TaxID=491952 RepID=F6D0N7_MARPP|nr:GGDEF domain-containing protein [Marinomonas posidonica]AEF54835.1 diguanylate cyclase [Marinomonas posidonica IVIA-Po-181]